MKNRLFDRVVMVDWSASSTPKTGKDSIWSCVLDATNGKHEALNHRTRSLAKDCVERVLCDSAGARVLVGFDFSYAYPSGTSVAAGLDGDQPWSAMWVHLARRIVDEPDNRNNRFAVASELNAAISGGFGPFWGTPSATASDSLSARKLSLVPHAHAAGMLDEFRIAERRFLDAKQRVSSTWQLFGAGSVGSQTLMGIPVLQYLRSHPLLADRSRVWPFETGLNRDPTGSRPDAIVHAEIWPGVISLDPTLHDVRDAAQVIGLCRHFAELDRGGMLADEFDPKLSDHERHLVLTEEGWILGTPAARE